MTTTTQPVVTTDTTRALTALVDRAATLGAQILHAAATPTGLTAHTTPTHADRLAKSLHLDEDILGGATRRWTGTWSGRHITLTTHR